MWEDVGVHLPRMKGDDPTTWTPLTEEEADRLKAARPEGGGDPYFGGSGHRFFIRNGAEARSLNLAPRALWRVAEQLLGEGTVVSPAGLDKDGMATGPSFMSDEAVSGLATHLGNDMGLPPEGTNKTETVSFPPTGPVWQNGQGTRGIYATLPNSPSNLPDYKSAHSDGGCYGRYRLQMAAYIDDVPANCGGFTVWPGSHTRIWKEQWDAFRAGHTHISKHPDGRKPGYTDPAILEIKRNEDPVDCHGPAGSVVLWHTKILHIAGQNASEDVLRQAVIYGFLKTAESLTDGLVIDNTDGDIWRDWSEEVRG